MEFLFRLDRIKEAPLQIEREISKDDLGWILAAEPATGFSPERPALFRGRLSRVNERDIVFEGEAPLALSSSCRRCLRPAHVDVEVRFQLDLVNRAHVKEREFMQIEDDGQGEIAGTFTPDEANQVLYEGPEIDLAPTVREQILLALPMGALCQEDCRGLCQVCGHNLNEGDCACDRHVPDPRWAALRSIKLPE